MIILVKYRKTSFQFLGIEECSLIWKKFQIQSKHHTLYGLFLRDCFYSASYRNHYSMRKTRKVKCWREQISFHCQHVLEISNKEICHLPKNLTRFFTEKHKSLGISTIKEDLKTGCFIVTKWRSTATHYSEHQFAST